MINLWEQVRHDLVWDGSLRDIYIQRTTLDNWNQFLRLVRATANYQYYVDSEPEILPAIAADIFLTEKYPKLLSIWIAEVQLNCHFFSQKEIELDLDPRQITNEETFNQIKQFMEQLAKALGRSTRLTPENLPGFPMLEYNPGSQCWEYFPTNKL
ncbi:hypothetical protein [Leptolyngbya ohadii]|uniref:hypothetical protein n=1 Tax=Leptolyngbya ohadii TaxID=1962290 RepID=UPI000B59E9D9|nr:hypothetical protein [Leptolyngbya ohadii]